MPEFVFLASNLTIIESTVLSSQFEKMIRDDSESVALVIKSLMSGIFFVHNFYGFQEKWILRTCGGILVITNYESETIFRNKHVISRIMNFFQNNFVLVFNIIMW